MALCNRHIGEGCKTLIGLQGQSWGTDVRIRKGEKNRQLCAVELNGSEELMKHR